MWLHGNGRTGGGQWSYKRPGGEVGLLVGGVERLALAWPGQGRHGPGAALSRLVRAQTREACHGPRGC